MITEDLLSILACPQCKGPVAYRRAAPKSEMPGAEESIDCGHCRLRYPVKDEIPVMLIDEAKKY